MLDFSPLSVLEHMWKVLTRPISYWCKWRHQKATILELNIQMQPASYIRLYITDSKKHNVLTETSVCKFTGEDCPTVKNSTACFQEAGVENLPL